MKRFRVFLKCFFFDHDTVLIDRSGDWLEGGEYTWHCERCDKTWKTRPYFGGYV